MLDGLGDAVSESKTKIDRIASAEMYSQSQSSVSTCLESNLSRSHSTQNLAPRSYYSDRKSKVSWNSSFTGIQWGIPFSSSFSLSFSMKIAWARKFPLIRFFFIQFWYSHRVLTGTPLTRTSFWKRLTGWHWNVSLTGTDFWGCLLNFCLFLWRLKNLASRCINTKTNSDRTFAVCFIDWFE